MHKISEYLPEQSVSLISSYLCFGSAVALPLPIVVYVSQGSVFEPLLYILYTVYIPSVNVTFATVADNTAILATNSDYYTANHYCKILPMPLQTGKVLGKLKSIDQNLHGSTSLYGTTPICPHNTPATRMMKYLEIHLASRVNWQHYIKKKCVELKLRFRSLYWLIGHKSKLDLYNKQLLYVMVLRRLWSYGQLI